MATFNRPDVYVEEKPQLEGPVQAAETGFGGLQGITEKGPVGSAVRVRSYADWVRVFGDREIRSDMSYEAKMFFDEGGLELITVRQAHFTDIDDRTSFVGGVSSRTSQTEGIAATAAAKTVGTPGPYSLVPGDTVSLDVDNAGPVTATFDAARATAAGAALAIVDLTSLTLILSIDGGASQTITFAGTESTVALVAQAINTQLSGGFAAVNATEVDISSDTQGTGSSVNITGGTALTEIGHSVALSSGTGDVADIDAVTTAEVKTVLEADITGQTVTVNPDLTYVITSDTTGITSELDFQASTGLTALGLSIEVLVGTDAGATQLTLTTEAGYHGELSPGVKGNDLSTLITRNPRRPSQGAANDLAVDAAATDTTLQVTTFSGLGPGSVIVIEDATNTEYHEVLAVRNVVTAGVVTFFVDLVGAGLTNAFTALLATIESREFDIAVYDGNSLVETWTDLSMLDTADNYVETIVNDEVVGSEYIVVTDEDAAAGLGADLPDADAARVDFAGGSDETVGLVDTDWIGTELGGTGIYAWQSIREFMPWATVGINSPALVHAATNFSQTRLYLEYLTFVTLGTTATNAVAWRNNTLGVDSSYGSLYTGGVKVYDPAQGGSNPRRSIVGLGGLMGLRGRVDSLPTPAGGPWQAPAGEGDFGKLRTALDVVDVYTDGEAGNLNDAHINALRKFGNSSPVLVFGARTLDNSTQQKFRYINVRRFFQFVELSVADSTRWALFRNNDFRLWGQLKDRVDDFLVGLMRDRAFPTQEKDEAFYITMGIPDGTMTQTNVDNGEVIGEIGLAPQKPGEFIIWRFTQFEGGTSIDEQ